MDIDRKIKTKKNIFIFQNRKRALHFFNFISSKYDLKPHAGGRRFTVKLNDTDFDIFVFAPQISDSYLDFTGLTDEDENDPGYHSEDAYHYIAIRVSSAYEDDCLSLNSLQYNVVVNYLKELKSEYLSTL